MMLEKVCLAVCFGGSLISTVFGLLAAQQAVDPATGAQVAIIAVITAMTGLFGSVALPAWRIWLEFRNKMQDDLAAVMKTIADNQELFRQNVHKFDVIIDNQERYLRQQKHTEAPKE